MRRVAPTIALSLHRLLPLGAARGGLAHLLAARQLGGGTRLRAAGGGSEVGCAAQLRRRWIKQGLQAGLALAGPAALLPAESWFE